MARKRRKKGYTRAERARIRERVEQKRKEKLGPGSTPDTVFEFKSRIYNLDAQIEQFISLGCDRKKAIKRLLKPVLKHRHQLLCGHAHGLQHLMGLDWVRQPGDWIPRGRNLDQIFASLAAHLLGTYPICPHLWASLHEGDYHAQIIARPLLVALAQGQSIRRLAGTSMLPVPLTRKMVHTLITPPRPRGMVYLIRRAQVLNYGGNEALADIMMEGCTFYEITEDEDYWSGVIHWLCRQDLPCYKDLNSITDYLEFRISENAPVVIRSRTMGSLLEEARFWEKAARKEFRKSCRRDNREERAGKSLQRRPASIKRYSSNDWAINEIRTPRQLILEGTIMRHCVATYRGEMWSGDCSFWSMTQEGKRRITIQVQNKEKRIDQVSGKTNRELRPEEVKHLQAWARDNGMTVPEWFLPGE